MAAERVIIVGSGPAGWSAAIYAARAELKPLLFEGAITEENRLSGTLPLGQLALTTEVENYAGFPAGELKHFLETAIAPDRLQYMAIHEGKHAVTGPELMELMRQQAINFGTRVVTDDIVKVDLQRRPFVVESREGISHETHALIIATGARANYLGLAIRGSVQEPRRKCLRGVRWCVASIPQQAADRRGRRRLGGRRSNVPHEVCLQGAHGPPPRQAASQHDHAGAGPR